MDVHSYGTNLLECDIKSRISEEAKKLFSPHDNNKNSIDSKERKKISSTNTAVSVKVVRHWLLKWRKRYAQS